MRCDTMVGDGAPCWLQNTKCDTNQNNHIKASIAKTKKKNEKPNIRMRIEIVVKNEANGIKIHTNSMQFSVRIV